MRRHFLRRVILTLVLFFGLTFAVGAVATAIFSDGFDRDDHGEPRFPGAVVGLGLLVVTFVVVGRVVRRAAGPVADVMEAADRVAAGDYTVRVQERGPGDTRRLARSFNAMTRRLQASEDQRRNLLADVTHELRTPLSVIQGNAEAMLDGVYPADRAHLEPVLEETRIMARLLEDLQTLSVAEAGALQLHRQMVDPAQLVTDAMAAFRPAAASTGISLLKRVDPGLPSVDVDPVRIGEVLSNLLTNALRHTPSGGSVVVAAEARGGEVVFSVEDTGAGIPAEVLPHVFDRFVKAADTGGAGLGLAIARSLVEAHGGEISAESPPGGGTTIRFRLPIRPG